MELIFLLIGLCLFIFVMLGSAKRLDKAKEKRINERRKEKILKEWKEIRDTQPYPYDGWS